MMKKAIAGAIALASVSDGFCDLDVVNLIDQWHRRDSIPIGFCDNRCRKPVFEVGSLDDIIPISFEGAYLVKHSASVFVISILSM